MIDLTILLNLSLSLIFAFSVYSCFITRATIVGKVLTVVAGCSVIYIHQPVFLIIGAGILLTTAIYLKDKKAAA